jgi:2-oxoglutarate ferredoxin oxidoreductase subunit gamma
VLERVIVAGFGGQGILFVARVVAEAMMHQGENVTYFPAYGPEVRGGRANCQVIISSDEIFSPVAARVDALLIMNQPSWDFFSARLEPEGLAVLNTSLATSDTGSPVRRLLPVPATDMASGLGDVRATNMVMLGAYNHVRKLLSVDTLLEHLRSVLGEQKAGLFDLNRQAIEKGIEVAEGSGIDSP